MDPFAANQTPVADDAAIVNRYPMPLARAWQRVLIAAARPPLHHEALLVLAETLAAVLGGYTVAAYQQRGGPPDPALNRSLRNLRHLTLGQWLGWIRSALAAVPPDQEPLPGLAAAYEATDSNLLLLGYEGLRGQMVVYLDYHGDYGQHSEASTRLVLELINQYQLRLAKHPPAPDSGWEPMSIVTALAPGLRAALARLALLADYPLLGLVRDAAGQVQVLRLMGFTAEESSVEMEPGVDPPGTLLLADPDELPMLVLDPWLVFTRCPECDNVQVAGLAGQTGQESEYFGLDCGHTWAVPAPPTPITLDLQEVAVPWTPDEGELVETPSALQEAMAAQFEADQQAMAAERARVRHAAPAAPSHVVTAEELETQTQALRAQIQHDGERRIGPEPAATLPEEEARLLAEYQRLEQLQAEDEHRFEERNRGNG